MDPQIKCIEDLPRPIGRLAPSPTGSLHLGNARSFLLAWLSIRQQNGTIILRIEDIDTPRVKDGSVTSTIDDLRWLGFDWDYGPNCQNGLVCGVPITQSARLQRYSQVLMQLIRDRRVYRCTCTRSQIAQAAASAPHEPGISQLEGPIYPGTCRTLMNAASTGFHFSDSDAAALRWAFQSGEINWTDGVLKQQSANPSRQLGDFVIGRANGLPAYQLAVVVDDHDMGVTEVVRGDDLAVSTYRQVDILNHLAWQLPNYYHVPLVLDADGRRMAKRQGDSLDFFRSQSVPPQVIIGYLAHSLGLLRKSQPISPQQLIGTLDWNKLSKQPTRFTGRFA
jgi:glutamyl-tRNA synthetase